MSGIRGDWRTFTCFRALLKGGYTHETVRWIFAVALPLLVQLFTPPGHENVLAAVDTILLDAGAVQTAVFNETRSCLPFGGRQILLLPRDQTEIPNLCASLYPPITTQGPPERNYTDGSYLHLHGSRECGRAG